MKKYKEFLFENINSFNEGDRVIITRRKSKYRNQTGVVTYLDWLDKDIRYVMVEVTLDYTDKVISCHIADIDKIDPIVKITEEDPYGEEDWSEEYL